MSITVRECVKANQVPLPIAEPEAETGWDPKNF